MCNDGKRELKIPPKKFNIKQTAAAQSVPNVKQYPTDVVLLDKYINGKQLTRTEMKKVKKLLSMTVITSNNAEKAKKQTNRKW